MAALVALEHSAQCVSDEGQASQRLHTGVAPAPTFSSQRKKDPEAQDLPRESG